MHALDTALHRSREEKSEREKERKRDRSNLEGFQKPARSG